MAEYDHKEICPMAVAVLLLGVASAVGSIGMLWRGWDPSPSLLVLPWFASVFGVGFGVAFLYVRVTDRGSALAIEYGPMRLVQADLPYRDMESVERAQVRRLRRWQVRWGGPVRVYAARSRGPAVRIKLKPLPGQRLPRAVVVGTDDPEGLLEFLRTRIGESA
ncbi:MAG: hypothetical protein R6V05_04790 [Candidatus Brocadiia bacterium]